MKTILLIILALAAYAAFIYLLGRLLASVSAHYPRWYAAHLADDTADTETTEPD